MLDLDLKAENKWIPPELTSQVVLACMEKSGEALFGYLAIFQVEPYIDSLFVMPDVSAQDGRIIKRFVFHENYVWDYEDEMFFQQHCLKNKRLEYTYTAINPIFKYYLQKYPEWHLQRYYTKGVRLLDYIYHCMRKNTAKEMLYKAGLDELAVNLDDIGGYNLLSTKPSDLYDGVSMRTLWALNCRYGSLLLSISTNREYIKDLQIKVPDIFKWELNDAQCRYLTRLIDAGLTVSEAGRLFNARRSALACVWARSQYELFLEKERTINELMKIEKLDPIYRETNY